MPYQLPKPENKSELKRIVTAWEARRFGKEPTNTLSKALNQDGFIEAWDLARLSPAEVAVIQDKFQQSNRDSLMLIHFRK